MTKKMLDDNHIDDHVDEEIISYLNPSQPKSFFMFAGAGSGKTRTLVNVLNEINKLYGTSFKRRGKKIAIITYTNAACDEIKSRLNFDQLFQISTIHSFTWDLIKPFQKDIKTWIKVYLEDSIEDLQKKQDKARNNKTKTYINRQHKIESYSSLLNEIDSIKKFVYNPNGDNREKESLNHSQVIQIGADFISRKPLMQKLFVTKYPILLIDESQDTNKTLLDAFLAVQQIYKDRFVLGLFGDIMQRIYFDGKPDLEKIIPKDWEKPVKAMNHRSAKRIVNLINKIRITMDNHEQKPRTDITEGIVRLFVCPVDSNKLETEKKIAKKMKDITNDESWLHSEFKKLTIEHHMAASRFGFSDIFDPLYKINEYKTSLLDGSLSGLQFFTGLILSLYNAYKSNDQFKIMSILKKNAPFFKNFTKENRISDFTNIKSAMNDLTSVFENEQSNCFNILQCVAKHELFEIPSMLRVFANLNQSEEQVFNSENEDEENNEMELQKIEAWNQVLKCTLDDMNRYNIYIKDESPFGTHQGVKGLEYENVMVILDDQEATGNMFSYDKLFGVKEMSPIDLKNEEEGKDTSIKRTTRLFYVTCSRAQKHLAIVVYTDNLQKLRDIVIEREWFKEGEILIIPMLNR